MPTTPEEYVKTSPGDLITAQLFNGLQVMIKQDIADRIQKAVSEIKDVERADDAAKLGGKTPKELEDEIVQRALAVLPTRTGYKMIFKRLTKDDEKVIAHNLKAAPLVDVYQLDYFRVVCARGENKEDQADTFVNFYLYNSSEKRLRSPVAPNPSIEIEPTDGKHHPFKIPFATMLDLVGLKYTDTQSLGDLETEFWKALYVNPNDEFDEDQFCHSPWFERCCGEQRSVATLKQRGDWNDIWFQMRPRKVVHFGFPTPPLAPNVPAPNPPSALADVQVVHFDFDTIGVQLLANPLYPATLLEKIGGPARLELKVMLLLKV
jgi:hypothetical protein